MYNKDIPTRAELPSSKQLLRSTLIAILIAAVLLITVVLPSEYGIDPTGIGRKLGLAEMGETKVMLEVAANTTTPLSVPQAVADRLGPPPLNSPQPAPAQAVANPNLKTDEVTVSLNPGEAIEVKLTMKSGAKVSYVWNVTGGAVYHDTHGEGNNGVFHHFSEGRGVQADAGELIAPFDGKVGW
jgi:hypothetical protein